MDRSDIFDRYIRNDMTPKERTSFEEELRLDDDLKEALDIHILSIDLIKRQGEIQLKSNLARHERRRKIKRGRIIFVWTIFIVVALILLYLSTDNRSTSSNNQLIAQYFEPYDNPIQLRGESPTDHLAKQAVELYRDERYQEANKAFNQAIESGNQPLYFFQFYQAMCILSSQELNNTEAIQLLKEVRIGTHDYKDAAEWYLALAYLSVDNHEMAINLLQKISLNEGHYANQAAELLTLIKR